MTYVEGYVLAVPKDKIEDYKAIALRAAPLWKEYGAIGYVESIADDVPYGEITSFPRAVQAKDDEIVVLSWILYDSRDARDAANAKMMADPRMKAEMENMPVDGARMIFGGFKPFLEM